MGLTTKKTVIKFETSGINRTMEYNGEQADAMRKLKEVAGNVKIKSGVCTTVKGYLKFGQFNITE